MNVFSRCEMYCIFNARFSFLLKLKKKKMSNEKIATACKNVATIYACYIDESELTEECQLAKSYFSSERFSDLSFQSMYDALFEDELVLMTTFPNFIYLFMFIFD